MKLCAKNHRVADVVNFCPRCGSGQFTEESDGSPSVATPSVAILRRLMAPRDDSSLEFRRRYPAVVVTMRAVRFLGMMWVLVGTIVVGTSYQHFQHRHVRGVLEANWLLAEVAVVVVGAVAFAVAYCALRLLRDLWERSSNRSSSPTTAGVR